VSDPQIVPTLQSYTLVYPMFAVILFLLFSGDRRCEYGIMAPGFVRLLRNPTDL
jgi:hypothetical protein